MCNTTLFIGNYIYEYSMKVRVIKNNMCLNQAFGAGNGAECLGCVPGAGTI